MAEMNKPVQNNNDEIDLIQVLERISRFLSNNKKLLIIAAIAGIFCGYAIYFLRPKLFSSTLILHSQVLANSEEIEIIETWNEMLKNGEYDILSKKFNCSEAVLRNLRSLKAADIQISQPSSGFTIDALVKDTAILERLQNALIYGLENNEYVKEKVDLKRNNTVKIIENINHEIAKLDSTKKKIETSNIGKGPGSSSFIVDISDVNVQMINLNEKLYQYQDVLKFVDAIQVLQSFEKYAKPFSPRLLTHIMSGFLGGLFIGFAMAIVKTVRSKIAMLSKATPDRIPNKELV